MRPEIGEVITAVCCMSAAGQYVSPILIFKRNRMNDDLYSGVPVGTLRLISDFRFIHSQLFMLSLKHFKNHVNLNKKTHSVNIKQPFLV